MRRRVKPPRQKLVLLVCLLAALVALSGCENIRENNAGREGLPEDIGHLEYNVYITRELNLYDVEDQGYYDGKEAAPGHALYGVFLTVCNPSEVVKSTHWQSASRFEIEDTLGNKYKAIPLPKSNVFSYQPQRLKHGACIPEPGSLAATSPTGGSLLIFDLPLEALENRPLNLLITSPPIGPEQEREIGRVELDV
jgi:hypothetical protein